MSSSRLLLALCALCGLAGCNVITGDLLGNNSSDDTHHDAASDSPIVQPAEGLVVDYTFEDGTGTMAMDAAHGLVATLSDAAMWSASGRNGKGLMMNGASPATQYVSLPNGMFEGVDDFTISVWVRLSGNPAWARIYDIGNGLPDPANRFMYLTTSGFTLSGESDGVHASSYGGSATNENTFGTHTYLPIGVWKHLALTGSGGQRRLYIDGFPAWNVENGPAVAPREMEPLAASSWLGKSRFASDPGFPGMMDELKVYNRVLTAGEIEDLAWPNADYSYWRFDESSGAAAKDSSNHDLASALASGASWTTGRLGGAVSFGGGAGSSNGPHVVIGANPLATCSTAFTIAAWLRINSYAVGSRLFDFGTSDTHSIYLSPNDGTGMHFAMKSPAGTFDLVTSSPPVPADATWHHVAVSVDSGGVVVLFVDGAPVKTQPSSQVKPADFANLADVYLGRSRAQDPYFDGAIDELRIACRALTPDEIKNLAYQ